MPYARGAGKRAYRFTTTTRAKSRRKKPTVPKTRGISQSMTVGKKPRKMTSQKRSQPTSIYQSHNDPLYPPKDQRTGMKGKRGRLTGVAKGFYGV